MLVSIVLTNQSHYFIITYLFQYKGCVYLYEIGLTHFLFAYHKLYTKILLGSEFFVNPRRQLRLHIVRGLDTKEHLTPSLLKVCMNICLTFQKRVLCLKPVPAGMWTLNCNGHRWLGMSNLIKLTTRKKFFMTLELGPSCQIFLKVYLHNGLMLHALLTLLFV